MRLRRIAAGDLVRLEGDPSLWMVQAKRGAWLDVALPRGSRVRRRVSSYEVAEAWRKVKH